MATPAAVESIVDVWPENVPAVKLFFAADTQWRISVVHAGDKISFVRHALDHCAVIALAPVVGVELTTDLWVRLKLLEAEAVKEMARG